METETFIPAYGNTEMLKENWPSWAQTVTSPYGSHSWAESKSIRHTRVPTAVSPPLHITLALLLHGTRFAHELAQV